MVKLLWDSILQPFFMRITILAIFSFFLIFSANAQLSNADILQTKLGALSIQPVQHASVVLSVNGKIIYADPSGGAKYFKGISLPDIILITDIHGDHFDTATLAGLADAHTILVVPQVVADKLSGSSKSKVVVLKNGETTEQLGISIMAIPMYNLPESPTAMHTKGRGNGYVLGIGGKTIYLSGDTQGIPEMRSLKNIDVAFVCMNLPYTMDVKEAADAVLAFKPTIVYPYHYRGRNGLSDVNAFKNLVESGDKHIEVRLRNWYPVL
jgi:L-ascorbate metabolism protein UlaG (beta-lactamase superfamily)